MGCLGKIVGTALLLGIGVAGGYMVAHHTSTETVECKVAKKAYFGEDQMVYCEAPGHTLRRYSNVRSYVQEKTLADVRGIDQDLVEGQTYKMNVYGLEKFGPKNILKVKKAGLDE